MSTKRKLAATKLAQPTLKQSAKSATQNKVTDQKTVVSGGGHAEAPPGSKEQAIEISSESEAEEDEYESDEEDEDDAVNGEVDAQQQADNDVQMEDADAGAAAEDAEDMAEPSFGDLVRTNASEPIDVAAAFPEAGEPSTHQGAKIQPPSGASLGTVLSQALKTNDVSLLESCLHTTDLTTIRATIQRLQSPLAGTLLQKLAERLHSRPGRAGSLMVWVQWCLVTHGGYLATQPALLKRLSELNRVVDQRARSLPSLLSLKGKLDMLEAQMQLRRNMQSQRHEDDDEDEEAVIYVEGEGSGDEEHALANGIAEGEESDEDMANGIIDESDEEEEEDDESDGEGLVDDEAEETDADSGDEEDAEEVNYEDQDSLSGDESEDEKQSAPPAKIRRTK